MNSDAKSNLSEVATTLNLESTTVSPHDENPPIAVEGLKSFIVRASLWNLLLNTNCVIALLGYYFYPDDFGNMFINYKSLYNNPYIYVAAGAIVLSLVALSVPLVARSKAGGWLFFIILYPCHLYTCLFMMMWSVKTMVLQYKPVTIAFAILFGTALGTFMGCVMFDGKKYGMGKSVGPSLIFSFGIVVLIWYFFPVPFSFKLYEYGIFGFAAGFWAFLINQDIRLMLLKQQWFYHKKDSLLGGAHLLTDPIGMFWYKLFMKPYENPEAPAPVEANRELDL